ncbi:50S ribosomal protein L3 [bacterium]|jgi:large subunit ribosomal protein L3|nr:50S ribosomal protein L3 [bacterium]MBT5015189.1 50S ribosomal protein L3 [bacterium]
MVSGLWGRKIGMTQIFQDDQTVIPVTVIDASSWIITQIKTDERDDYSAVQIGQVRKKYANEAFDISWIKALRKYFIEVKEVKVSDESLATLKVGQQVEFHNDLAEGTTVNIFGTTIGKGFAGVVKRYNFGGGRKTHGSTFHRAPGSIGFMATQGRVIKGKKMPGQMGSKKRVVKNLEIIKVDPNAQVILVKGSVPGKAGSLVYLQKNG